MITTERAALEAVRQDGWALRDVPDGLRTPAVCREAVRNGAPLASVPAHIRSEEICREALRQECWVLAAVPERLRTPAVLTATGEEEEE